MYFGNLGGDGKAPAQLRSAHAHNPPHTRPVLVMDMYEHAYHMDFGAAAAEYIDAFFANVNWDEVAKRVTV